MNCNCLSIIVNFLNAARICVPGNREPLVHLEAPLQFSKRPCEMQRSKHTRSLPHPVA